MWGARFLAKSGKASQDIFYSLFTAGYKDDTDFSGSGRRVAARSCHGNGRSTLAGAGEPNEAGPVEAAVPAATRRTSQAARLSLQFDFAGDPPSPGFGVASTPATTDLRAASAGGVAGKALCGRLATHRNAMSLLPRLEVNAAPLALNRCAESFRETIAARCPCCSIALRTAHTTVAASLCRAPRKETTGRGD